MDDFNYAIAAILGAMLVVISMDAYLFFTEVMSRQWTSSGLVSKDTFHVSVGSLLLCGNGSWSRHPISAFGSGTPIGMTTFGMRNESTDGLQCWRWPA